MKKRILIAVSLLLIVLATIILSTLIFLVSSGAFRSLLSVVEKTSTEEHAHLESNSFQVMENYDENLLYETISEEEIEKSPKASNCQFVFGKNKGITDLLELDGYGTPSEEFDVSYIVFAEEKTVMLYETKNKYYPIRASGNAFEHVRNGRETQIFDGERARILDLFFQVENGGTEVFYKTNHGNFVRCYPEHGEMYWEFEQSEYVQLQMECKKIADESLGRDSGVIGLNHYIEIFPYLEDADQAGLYKENYRQTEEQLQCIPKIYGLFATLIAFACISVAVLFLYKFKKALAPAPDGPAPDTPDAGGADSACQPTPPAEPQ